jgi:hypothetical protein
MKKYVQYKAKLIVGLIVLLLNMTLILITGSRPSLGNLRHQYWRGLSVIGYDNAGNSGMTKLS